MRFNRLNSMEEYISDKDYVSLDELCNVFGRSKTTIRRDVADLLAKGTIEKVYGGIKPMKQSLNLISFSDRMIKLSQEKKDIGKIASEYIEDGDTIYLDSGTTTINIIPFLEHVSNITILTNNLYAITKCMEYPNINTISFGGSVDPTTASFIMDYYSIKHIQKFNIKKAFMASTGVSIENGATNKATNETPIKSIVTNISDICFLLADTTKFDNSSLLTYADLTDFNYIITDQKPSKKYIDFFENHNIIYRY